MVDYRDINSIKEFNKYLDKSANYLLIVYFYSLKNGSEELNNSINTIFRDCCNGNINAIKVNIDNNEPLIKHIDLTTYPVFHIYKNKNKIQELYSSYDNLETILNNLISII